MMQFQKGFTLVALVFLSGCSYLKPSSGSFFKSFLSSIPPSSNLPVDTREITFPTDMTSLGYEDVTQGGAALNCPDALPNLSDTASVNQTTQAIQCRLNHAQSNGSGWVLNLYFPAGIYYINQTLSLTNAVIPTNTTTHILGRDPATTKIVWMGSCGLDPNVEAQFTKYNDIFYDGGISPLLMERLTLDGQNCAGSGIDMFSLAGAYVGGNIFNELIIQNLKEVGIVGGRSPLTSQEFSSGGGSLAVAEVSITRVEFHNIGYAGVLTGSANALDYWIRDSLFDHCAIGLTNASITNNRLFNGPTVALNWNGSQQGGFQASNNIFQNSQIADVFVFNSHWIALHSNYSVGSKGPFFEAPDQVLGMQAYLDGNTVISGPNVIPVIDPAGSSGGANLLTLIDNTFITSQNYPAVLAFSVKYQSALAELSAINSLAYNNTFSQVVSIGNHYSSNTPFSNVANYGASSSSGFAASSSGLQCSSGDWASGIDTSALLDNRTYCSDAFPAWSNFSEYNLYTFDDEAGISSSPAMPALPPIRPEVNRNSITLKLVSGDTVTQAMANTETLQKAVNSLVAQQASCKSGDYSCPSHLGVIFIPSGIWYFGSTVSIPAQASIQIVGTYTSFLYPFYRSPDSAGTALLPTTVMPLFHIAAPSQVVMRDFTIIGGSGIYGVEAEVVDSSNSRVVSDRMLSNDISVEGIGNVPFEMRSFTANGNANISGNGSPNSPGYFAEFGGNTGSFLLFKGASLMVQDTWLEGTGSSFISCPTGGGSGTFTIEAALINPDYCRIAGGVFCSDPTHYPDVAANLGGSDYKYGLNYNDCALKGSLLSADLFRQDIPVEDYMTTLEFTANTNPQAKSLFLNVLTENNSEANIYGLIPTTDTTDLDQGAFLADPGTTAQYANILGYFGLNQNPGQQNQYNITYLNSKNTGNTDPSFVRGMLAQARDPRQAAPMKVIPPITNVSTSDLQFYHVSIYTAQPEDMRFVLPGTTN